MHGEIIAFLDTWILSVSSQRSVKNIIITPALINRMHDGSTSPPHINLSFIQIFAQKRRLLILTYDRGGMAETRTSSAGERLNASIPKKDYEQNWAEKKDPYGLALVSLGFFFCTVHEGCSLSETQGQSQRTFAS